MHKTNPSEPDAGQAPINQEELVSIERELRFHTELSQSSMFFSRRNKYEMPFRI
jgi:hypothetical protein